MNDKLMVACAVLLAACATVPPSIQRGPGAEVSFDGLHRIDHARFDEAWADPDIDFTAYRKVLPDPVSFEFRAVRKTPAVTMQRRSTDEEYWIDDDAKQQLIVEVSAIFREELQKSTRFALTGEPGPDVMILRAGLHDIVSRVPPEMIGRGEVYLRSVGEATLVLEAVDSMSGETIYRAVERRSAERPGDAIMAANPVTSWAEVRRLARRWATDMREGLDSIPQS